jgi:hypothetical protein
LGRGPFKLGAVSTPPSELPPPPLGGPAASGQPPVPTQIAGQQTTPSTTVPHTPGLVPATGAGHTNSLAVISLVAGIGSFFAHVIPGIGGATVAIVAIITGFMARNQIKKSGEQGMGMATAGMVIGIVHLGLIVLVVIGVIIAILVFGIALFGFSTHTS